MIKQSAIIVLAATLLSLGGCRWLTGRRDEPRPGPAPDVVQGQVKPTPEQLVSYMNRKSELLNSIETRDLYIDAEAQGTKLSLDGRLSCQKPRSLSLVGRKFAADRVIVGSNDDRFWFYVDQDPQNALYFCKYTDFEKGVELPFPFEPEWVLEVMGMAKINPSANARVEEEGKTYQLIEETQVRGQRVRKETVFYKGMARDNQPQIISRTVTDLSNNRVICRATINEVTRIPVDRDGLTPDFVIAPKVLTLEWPIQDMKLRLTLDRMKVNGSIDPGTFSMPQVGRKTVDIGTVKPTGHRLSLGQ